MKTDVVSYLPLWRPSACPLPVAQWWGLLWILWERAAAWPPSLLCTEHSEPPSRGTLPVGEQSWTSAAPGLWPPSCTCSCWADGRPSASCTCVSGACPRQVQENARPWAWRQSCLSTCWVSQTEQADVCMIKRGPSLYLSLFPSPWLMSTMCLPAVRRVGSQSCFDIRCEALPAVWQVMLFLCLTCSHSSLVCLPPAKLQPWSDSVRLQESNELNKLLFGTFTVFLNYTVSYETKP